MHFWRMLGLASCEQMMAAFSFPNIGFTVPTCAGWPVGVPTRARGAAGDGVGGTGTGACRWTIGMDRAAGDGRVASACDDPALVRARTVPRRIVVARIFGMSASFAQRGSLRSLPKSRSPTGLGSKRRPDGLTRPA
jgi:hypothetical protein